jgi:hypothetical protein
MDISVLTYEKIKAIMTGKGYPFFTDLFDLNIIGIRTADNVVNTFKDYLLFVRSDKNGNMVKIYPATTDPGLFWLEHPENVKGTAIVKPGHYPKLWTPGIHFTYRALVQENPITVYRDGNRDDNLDAIPGTEDTGMFGINCHHAGEDSQTVGQWSAGCQVFQKLADFIEAMGFVDDQIKALLGYFFSYSLLEEKDFL